MARVPWHLAGPTRNLPIAATGGVPIVLAPPHPSAGQAWTMAKCKPTAAVIATATTLTLATTATWNEAEAWATLRVTADRLRDTSFRWMGRVYRITAHSVAALITWTPALVDPIGANDDIEIQADLPPILSYLLLDTAGVAIQWSMSEDDTPVEAEMADLANGESEILVDTDQIIGTPAKKVQIVGSGAAGSAQVRCFAA